MIPRARTFNCSSSASVTGGFTTRLPVTALGSAAVASYPCFCWSLVAYSSYTRFSSGRALSMARVAAESAS
ncbi:hypothetical protein [Micromonospora psammae]|uniref:hypothetical protein n=1 Tax=Micromonospora sp. CPCC 205556 TaxID=3122398 RepID=UPI002FF30D88